MSFLLKMEECTVKFLTLEKHNDIEREKIKFGVRLIFNDIWKIIIVYAIAFFLHVFLATLLTHIIFFILRQVSFGFHFQNSFVCLISSIVSLPIAVYLIKNVELNSMYFYILALISTLILLFLAPVGTKKRPVINQKHRIYLRKKLFIRMALCWAVVFIVNSNYQSFILFAIILIGISVLTQKFIGVE